MLHKKLHARKDNVSIGRCESMGDHSCRKKSITHTKVSPGWEGYEDCRCCWRLMNDATCRPSFKARHQLPSLSVHSRAFAVPFLPSDAPASRRARLAPRELIGGASSSKLQDLRLSWLIKSRRGGYASATSKSGWSIGSLDASISSRGRWYWGLWKVAFWPRLMKQLADRN
jgi:hypothetical protein